MSAEAYPEHQKQALIHEQAQVIGLFLDEMPYILAEHRQIDGYSEEQLMPVNKRIEQVLAEYFDIDLTKIEAEKRAMLRNLPE